MKKVLAIGHSFVLAQNRDVLRHLHTSGKWDVTVLAPRFFHGDLRDIHIESEPEGSDMKVIPVECYGTRWIHFFMYNTLQVEKLLRQEKFDAVYLWEEAYIVAGFTLAHVFHKYKIPYFIYCSQNIYKKLPWPFSFLENKVFSHAKNILACGYGVREVLAQKNHKSDVVPLFVSLDRFKVQTAENKATLRAKMGLKESFTVGFMGRLVEAKGLKLFMKVLDDVLSVKKCNIIVIGAGPLKVEAEEWAKTKENSRVLTLNHEDVPNVLSLLDVILCPSQTMPNWKEQFGRMLVEAFASGVPVLGSSSGEIPHVIGDAGVILDESDVKQWVREVLRVMDGDDVRATMVEKGLNQAQKYSVNSVAQTTYDAVEKSFHGM